MIYQNRIQLIFSLLIFFHTTVKCQGQTTQSVSIEEYQIPYCSKYLNVATFKDKDNPNSMRICIKCQKMRVLTSDFKKCLHVREELGNLKLANCKRLSYEGFCAEALDGIEIIDNKYSFTADYFQNNRCAIVTKNYESCLFPRFGYTLDFKQQKIYQDNSQYPVFCELYDSFINKCIQYFKYFLPSPTNGLSVYLDNFINPHLVDYVVSNSLRIICIDTKQFFTNKNIYGCLSRDIIYNMVRKIDNCQKYFLKKFICQQCKEGFVLRTTYQDCDPIVIPNCTLFEIIEGKDTCIQCKPFYRISFMECVPLLHCKMIHPLNQNVCVACESPYQLNLLTNSCEKTEQIDNEQQCQLFQDNGECILCQNNNHYYLLSNYCVLRQKSLFCREFDPFNDSCLTLECLDDSYVVKIIREDFSFNFEYPDISETIQRHLIKYKRVTQKPFSIICNKRINYPIIGCKSYSPIAESCEQCAQGYYIFRINLDQQNQGQGNPNIFDRQKNPKINQESLHCSTISNNQISYIDKCIKYSLDGIYCVKCQPGYFENKTECVKGVDNCSIHQDIKTCLECEEGYISYQTNMNFKNIVYNKRCQKNQNIRNIYKKNNNFSYDNNNSEDALDFIKNKKYQCSYSIPGSIRIKNQNICLNDLEFPDCQFAEINEKNQIECISCWLEYTFYQGKCYLSGLFSFNKTQNQQMYSLNKRCMSAINISTEQCEVNIPENIVILDDSKYGEVIKDPYFKIDNCTFSNCKMCEKDRCLKCNKFYQLTDKGYCKRVCVGPILSDECNQQPITEDLANEETQLKDISQEQQNKAKEQNINTFIIQIVEIVIIKFIVLFLILLIISLYQYLKRKRLETSQGGYYYQFKH